jgi:hypothetical protein
MNATLRLILGASVVLAAFGWLELWHPGWLGRIGPEAASLPQVKDEIETDSRESQELDKQLQVVLSRIEARRQVISSLLAGQMTLAEAVARFKELDAARSANEKEWLRRAYGAVSDEECCYRQVLRNVASQLRARPQQASEIEARLRAELEARLACGAMGLPQ